MDWLGDKKAYKTVAAFLVTFVTYLLLNDVIPNPWDVITSAAVNAAVVFGVPNPARGTRKANNGH